MEIEERGYYSISGQVHLRGTGIDGMKTYYNDYFFDRAGEYEVDTEKNKVTFLRSLMYEGRIQGIEPDMIILDESGKIPEQCFVPIKPNICEGTVVYSGTPKPETITTTEIQDMRKLAHGIMEDDFKMPIKDPDKEDESTGFEAGTTRMIKEWLDESFAEVAKKQNKTNGYSNTDHGYIREYFAKVPEPTISSCNHNWKPYAGLIETYQYCSICDEKKK